MQRPVRTLTLRLELCDGCIYSVGNYHAHWPTSLHDALPLSVLVIPHQQLQTCVCCLFMDVLFGSSDDANVSLDLTMSFSFLFTHTLCASVTILSIVHTHMCTTV